MNGLQLKRTDPQSPRKHRVLDREVAAAWALAVFLLTGLLAF